MTKMPVIMTIAGSDSGGGAGIQADLKTMTVLGGFGVSVIAALTAQNGAGVRGIHAPDADFVRLQLETLLDGFPIAAAKTGMLFSAPIMEGVADCLKKKTFPLVVDPVAVSRAGDKLLRDDAVAVLTEKILPLADLVTPNIPEAELLTGMPLRSENDILPVAERLIAKGAKAVLLKGGPLGRQGHAEAAVMTDWLCLPGAAPRAFTHKFVVTDNTHGTGCTLSAALATFLGQGQSLEDAIVLSQHYLVAALTASFTPGIGRGAPHFAAGADAVRSRG